jgi:GH24 family phage-related lysozyme (muramidase)
MTHYPALEAWAASMQVIIDAIKSEQITEKPANNSILTKQVLLEIISHEGIVPEAYKDSKGIWTWGIGVTTASGHSVQRYIDHPQPLSRVIEVYKWLLETKYLPDVLEAFKGHKLSENELASALSFHYNTGAIKKASWVKAFMAGNVSSAKQLFMNYRKPVEIIDRRTKERDLFFKGSWSNDGKALVYSEVSKPSYVPRWRSAKRVDISKEL